VGVEDGAGDLDEREGGGVGEQIAEHGAGEIVDGQPELHGGAEQAL
jgi:hypothetical protein